MHHVHPSTYMYLPIYLFTNLPILHASNYLCTHPPTYLPIHLIFINYPSSCRSIHLPAYWAYRAYLSTNGTGAVAIGRSACMAKAAASWPRQWMSCLPERMARLAATQRGGSQPTMSELAIGENHRRHVWRFRFCIYRMNQLIPI